MDARAPTSSGGPGAATGAPPATRQGRREGLAVSRLGPRQASTLQRLGELALAHGATYSMEIDRARRAAGSVSSPGSTAQVLRSLLARGLARYVDAALRPAAPQGARLVAPTEAGWEVWRRARACEGAGS